MIKLNQKRTCERCKALYMERYVSTCELGYKINDKFKPLEPCPKPKTIMELFECRKLYKK